jgi:hypothetical protein
MGVLVKVPGGSGDGGLFAKALVRATSCCRGGFALGVIPLVGFSDVFCLLEEFVGVGAFAKGAFAKGAFGPTGFRLVTRTFVCGRRR